LQWLQLHAAPPLKFNRRRLKLHRRCLEALGSFFLIVSFENVVIFSVIQRRGALDRLHDHAVLSDVCFVCGNSFAANPVNCNVHAFSAGEGGQGAGAFVMMNSSKKHDSVQVCLLILDLHLSHGYN
jgi:hypothetical protein